MSVSLLHHPVGRSSYARMLIEREREREREIPPPHNLSSSPCFLPVVDHACMHACPIDPN